MTLPPSWAGGGLLIGTLCGALVAGRLETGLLCLGIAGVAAVALRAPWPPARWRWTLATSAMLGLALNLYLTPGEALAGWPSVWGRSATRTGLDHGVLLMLRLLGALASLQALRAAWPGELAADMLAVALRPLERLRVPVREARTLAGLALRFAPLIESEARRIGAVQALRAGTQAVGLRGWLRRRRAAAVPTMVSSLERAERVALALEARHYPLRGAWRASAPGRKAVPWGLAGATLFGTALLWR